MQQTAAAVCLELTIALVNSYEDTRCGVNRFRAKTTVSRST